MARTRGTMGFDAVRAIARSLPDVEESTSWGMPSLKLRGRMLACMAAHKSAEPGTLVVCVSVDQRDAMIADDPAIYYLKDHYVGHPCVLARLARIERGALADLLHTAWRFADAAGPTRRPAARRRRTSRPGSSRPGGGARSRRR